MKLNKTKKITLGAIATFAALAAASSATATFAWFTAANTVAVTGMNIQAEVENGIVIANAVPSADSDWKTTITAANTGAGAKFVATSTSDFATWYHGLSDLADNGQSNVDYDTFGEMTTTQGVASAKSSKHFTTEAKNVYLVNEFYIQASAKSTITEQDLYIKDITVTGNTGSANLDKSLRVGLMVNGVKQDIYAPLAGSTLTYGVNGVANAVTAIDVSADDDKTRILQNTTIPAYTTTGTDAIKLKVFVYFEGEDTNHKSANITNSLDTLALSFKFENVKHA